SSQGRFLNRDPSGYNGGMNLYGYANQDPVNLNDPLGLNPLPHGTNCSFSLSFGPSDYPWLVFDNDSVYNGLTQGFRNGQVVSGFIAEVPIPPVSYVGQIGSSVSGFGSLVMKGISGGDGDAGVNAVAPSVHGTRPGDLPARGQPNSVACKDYGNGEGQIREYGPDGRAKVDYDFGHDHTNCGDPHAHDWDWSQPRPRQGPRPIGIDE
ncbi:MAG TPA: RHS repeat-associated core domain-containing protein, partial [Armatimonadota bacterium]|nr:RHS repeat-associated core domain-containing protein [Armatimonadota bacterium]